MGEKKMLQKERKTCSQKKSKKAIVVPRSRSHRDETPPYWCPSLGSTWNCEKTGEGGTTKSWISSSSPSPCCNRVQSCPQLAVVDFSGKLINIWPPDSITSYISVSVTGVSSPAFSFFKYDPKDYRRGGSWKNIYCRVTEPFSAEYHRKMEFTNLIGLGRKYYAISRQGCLALIEDDEGNSGNFDITALGRRRVVPRCKVSKHFREYMLECNGEIYLVFLLSRTSINKVDGVEVYRLDRTRLLWEKVDQLKGDSMFFLRGYGCLGISASKLRCSKGSNCVYFTHDIADGAWFVYDMKTSCISPTSGPERDLPIT